jgi:NAD(P)-dependent dehydrogenase (short-subunit alcohol dehydrogenase family)
MRKQKSGKIIVTSSIGGMNGAPFNDVYCASKFACEGLVESMAAVYKKLGIDIISIEPGATKSEFINNV